MAQNPLNGNLILTTEKFDGIPVDWETVFYKMSKDGSDCQQIENDLEGFRIYITDFDKSGNFIF